MTTPAFTEYLRTVARLLEQAVESGQDALDRAAAAMTEAIAAGRVVRVFGASHAGLLAQDLFYRAGGLAAIDPVLPGGLMLDQRPVTRTTRLERLPGYGRAIFADVPLSAGDVLVLISVSGRNPVVVEACDVAHERGATVVALTSLAYSGQVSGRSGPRLFERADIVLDLPGLPGDAAVTVAPGIAAGPTSSAVGAAMLHGLCVEVAARLAGRGQPPPVFTSANLDGGAERNEELLRAYRGRVGYL